MALMGLRCGDLRDGLLQQLTKSSLTETEYLLPKTPTARPARTNCSALYSHDPPSVQTRTLSTRTRRPRIQKARSRVKKLRNKVDQ